MPLPTRDEAYALLCEWVESESLRRHMLAVEAALRAYARYYGEDEELWGLTGLLHDLDYERHPDMDDLVNGHPRTELRLFRERDYPRRVDPRRGGARDVSERPEREPAGQGAARLRRVDGADPRPASMCAPTGTSARR